MDFLTKAMSPRLFDFSRKTKTKVYEIEVNAVNGEKSISFPDEMGLLKHWKVGEKTYWIDHGNGNWSVYVNQTDGEEDASEVSTD